MTSWFPFILLAVALALPVQAQQPAVSSIGIQGTEIVVGLADGRTLRSKDLVGAVLEVRIEDQLAKVRIGAVEPDPKDKTGAVWLHTLEGRLPDGSWSNLCSPGPDGRRQGFLLQMNGGLQLICSAGALGKCVRFGYRPWAADADGKSLAPQHTACVRMVRGDYGGSDEAWTSDGMLIDVFDPQGIQTAEGGDLEFEAGWAPDGAVCVHHVRVKENTTLAALEQMYPRLKGRTGAICTEEYARSLGAIVLNRSPP